MRPQFSIKFLFLVGFILSAGVAIAVHRAETQRHAIAVIIGSDGQTYSNSIKLDTSLSTNLRYSATRIAIPRADYSMAFTNVIDDLPHLESIELTSDYDPKWMAGLRSRYPQIKITHTFEPMLGLIE